MQTLRAMVTEYETSGGSIDKIERLYDSTVTPGPAPDFRPVPPEFPADFQIRAPPRNRWWMIHPAPIGKTRWC
jgi:hypothetical protein